MLGTRTPVRRPFTVCSSAAVNKLYKGKGKRNPQSITERRVPQLIPVLGSQPASDVSHKPGGKNEPYKLPTIRCVAADVDDR